MFFLSFADFFIFKHSFRKIIRVSNSLDPNQARHFCFMFFFGLLLIFSFLNILSGKSSECQTVWIQITPYILSGLIWAQTVCRGYQQTRPVGEEVFFFCLFFLFDSLRPINNLSVIKGRVFLGWTSTRLGLMFLLKDTTQWRWCLNPPPLCLESSSLPLSHCIP